MGFVVDASVTLPWFLDDERTVFTEAVFASMKSSEYWTPAIWCLEFPNALFAAEKKRRIDRATRLGILDRASRMNIRIDARTPDMRVVSELAERYGLSTYDAAYLDLALRQNLGLITLDRDLAAAATAAGLALQSPGRGTLAQRRRRYNV